MTDWGVNKQPLTLQQELWYTPLRGNRQTVKIRIRVYNMGYIEFRTLGKGYISSAQVEEFSSHLSHIFLNLAGQPLCEYSTFFIGENSINGSNPLLNSRGRFLDPGPGYFHSGQEQGLLDIFPLQGWRVGLVDTGGGIKLGRNPCSFNSIFRFS